MTHIWLSISQRLTGTDPVNYSVIFIHGLTGDRERTWTAMGQTEPWPKTLLPTVLPKARILTFGYDAYVTSFRDLVSKNRIGNHAKDLLGKLAIYRGKDDTVLFPGFYNMRALLSSSHRRTVRFSLFVTA
jgi:hypothetical protein